VSINNVIGNVITILTGVWINNVIGNVITILTGVWINNVIGNVITILTGGVNQQCYRQCYHHP
jgi:fatty acid desaturase